MFIKDQSIQASLLGLYANRPRILEPVSLFLAYGADSTGEKCGQESITPVGGYNNFEKFLLELFKLVLPRTELAFFTVTYRNAPVVLEHDGDS